MAAKKKSSAQDQWDRAVKSGAIRPVKSAPVEALSKPGQAKPTGGKTKTTALPSPKTRVINNPSGMTLRGSGTPLGTSMGINPINKKQLLGAAGSVAIGVAGSAIKIGTRQVVSEATKKLQRELSKELKTRSGKGMSKNERVGQAETRSEWSPEDYAEWKSQPSEMQKRISESMKSTTKKKLSVKVKNPKK